MASARALRILSVDLCDQCELQIGWLSTGAVSVVLTDGGTAFRGEMGSLDPLWAVLNGAAAAARGKKALVGLARSGPQIDVVAHERGKGVGLAARFSPHDFSHLLDKLAARRPTDEMAGGYVPPQPEVPPHISAAELARH